jgi:hypothetical protein
LTDGIGGSVQQHFIHHPFHRSIGSIKIFVAEQLAVAMFFASGRWIKRYSLYVNMGPSDVV